MDMENKTAQTIGIKVQLAVDFDSAYALTVDALKTEGFGVLTEIDVRETMKKKLGVDFPAYKILGACNPPLAHQALTAAPEVGLLLPCNVTIRQLEDGGVEVALVDPLSMLGVVPDPDIQPVAEQAAARLNRVKLALERGA